MVRIVGLLGVRGKVWSSLPLTDVDQALARSAADAVQTPALRGRERFDPLLRDHRRPSQSCKIGLLSSGPDTGALLGHSGA